MYLDDIENIENNLTFSLLKQTEMFKLEKTNLVKTIIFIKENLN